MTEAKRKVEVFVAGCPLCEEAKRLVESLACPACQVTFYDLREGGEALEKARAYGVTSVPAVVVEGRLAECCKRPSVDEEALRRAGVGAG